jgi:protein-S-isoprenylcysteine O-methyltransferase Ste14
MATAALAIYGGWLILAFGLRAAIQRRRTGDWGLRGFSGRIGSAEWVAGLSFVIALAIGFAAPVTHLVETLRPIEFLDASPLRWVGLVAACVGVIATLSAQLSMGDSWRVGVDPEESTELVVDGVFALSRNPIFAAMGLAAAGLTLMVPNVLSVAGLILLLVAVQLQVRLVEEPYLATVHGPRYISYLERVGRFVPGIGRR